MYVMMYFMHLKFEGAWKWVLLAPTVILALAVPAALAPDIAFKYYDPQNPQQKAYREQQALEKAAHAEAHPAAAAPAGEAHPAEKH
jgi:cytochrome c oxidase subunit 4